MTDEEILIDELERITAWLEGSTEEQRIELLIEAGIIDTDFNILPPYEGIVKLMEEEE